MIGALVYSLMYLYFGVLTVRFLLPRHRPLNRIWLGLSLGLLEEMWLPALGAFWLSFGVEAHVFGAAVLFALTLAAWFLRDRRDPAGWDDRERELLRQMLIFCIPLTLLGIWLQYSHVMRTDAAGNWHVGQSTYGDLPMHLSFITGLVGKKFPADYPFYPGARLSYPFLTDSLSSTFLVLGCSLQAAVILPAVLMMALCYMGVLVLGRDMTGGRRTALLAAALALPQLFGFTFRQVFEKEGGTGNFLRLQFNWVNNPGGRGMRDFYIWFYVKNIGLPFVLLMLACFEKDAHMRRILMAALPIVILGETVRFQPNEYDNNKLFYLAYLLCTMVISDYAAILYRKLKGVRARPLMAAAALVCFFLSAGLTLWRECVSSYQAFSASAVEAGVFVRDNTEEDSVFLSGTQHLNPVSSIAGRTTVCGPDLWLYWHGIDTSERKMDIAAFMTDPEANLEILEKYGVDYIYVSSYERSSYSVDLTAMDALFERVFENREAVVYSVREAKEE